MKPRSKDLLLKKYTKIFERYNAMYWGKMMRDDAIYPILKEEFHLEEKTLYGIVLKMSKLAALEKQPA